MQTTNIATDNEQFKVHLREFLAENPQRITFEIKSVDPNKKTEIYPTRLSFGNRLLELFAGVRLNSLSLVSITIGEDIIVTDTIIDDSGHIFKNVDKVTFVMETIAEMASRVLRIKNQQKANYNESK